jgi:hypothetical protein
MGMFDHYRPKPDLKCPVCGTARLEWQGKDGPCGLFLWEQGHAAPVDQLVDDQWKISKEDLAKVRLPKRFEIYAQCQCSTFVSIVGFVEEGVWTRSEILDQANAVAYPGESESEFKERLLTLPKLPGHAE